nr:carboxylesterase 5A-like [Penaeus vannamei]
MEFDLTRIDPLVKCQYLGLTPTLLPLPSSSATASTACATWRPSSTTRATPPSASAPSPTSCSTAGSTPSPTCSGGPRPWNLAYVGDSDDLQYLFSFDKLNVSLTKEEDLFVSRIMVDLWTNFAATGNPTPDLSLGFKWTPTEASSLSYLGITSAPAMKVYDREQDIEFWRNLPRKMNKLLYPDRFSQNSN